MSGVKRPGKSALCLAAACALLACPLSAHAIGFDAEAAYESVFVVVTERSMGSGFAVGTNCVVTNAHVIEDAQNIRVLTYSDEEHPAQVLLRAEDLDLAILVVEGASFTPLHVANIDDVGIGDDVYTIGAPNSLAYTLTKGVVSAKDRTIGENTYIQTDAAINEGNSGGPLLNDAGEVLGVNSLKLSDSEGLGLSIPMDLVCAFLRDNGLTLDEYGNIQGAVERPDIEPIPEDTADVGADGESLAAEKPSNAGLIAGLCLSIALNAILLILLLRGGKRSLPKVDPSERTDFEIDITN